MLTEVTTKKPVDFYRRNLQRAYVQNLIDKAARPADTSGDPFAAFFRGPNTYNTDVRAISRARLKAIQKKLQGAKGADGMTTAHFEDLDLQIRQALEAKS